MEIDVSGCPSTGEVPDARNACVWVLLERVFFFQAEDGIRDGRVTGVQTCALPISGLSITMIAASSKAILSGMRCACGMSVGGGGGSSTTRSPPITGFFPSDEAPSTLIWPDLSQEIGRASCRERREISVGAVSFKKK